MNALKIFTLTLFVSMLASCGNTNPPKEDTPQDTIMVEEPVVLSDSMRDEMNMAYRRYMDLYTSEQYNKYVEYLYPGYFTYMHKTNPGMTDTDAKMKYIDLLLDRSENYWENNISVIAPNTTRYKYYLNKIENIRKDSDNLLVAFSQKAVYYTGKDSVISPNMEYGIGIYLAKKAMWYFLDNSIDNVSEILRSDFSQSAIDSIMSTPSFDL